jgi:hypothetical protein
MRAVSTSHRDILSIEKLRQRGLDQSNQVVLRVLVPVKDVNAKRQVFLATAQRVSVKRKGLSVLGKEQRDRRHTFHSGSSVTLSTSDSYTFENARESSTPGLQSSRTARWIDHRIQTLLALLELEVRIRLAEQILAI